MTDSEITTITVHRLLRNKLKGLKDKWRLRRVEQVIEKLLERSGE